MNVSYKESLSNHYVHNLNPIAFEVFGVIFTWYWLSYLIGLFFAIWYGKRIIETKKINLPEHVFWKQLQWGWPALFIGSRVFYVLFYHWEFFKNNPALIPQLWLGGMSFHGALLGISLSAILISRKTQTSYFAYTDIIATIAPIGLFFGRIANFINGELAGRPTQVPWAVVFPQLYDDLPRHPSQLYQALGEGLVLFIILFISSKKSFRFEGQQTSLFLMGYGFIRLITEFFRMPDPQLGTWMSLTMGQYLCLIMLLIGMIIFLRSKPSPTLP